MYAIKWTVKPTLYQEQGEFIFKTREKAQDQCNKMNNKFEYIQHEVIEEQL